jgi:predicted ATPase/class 3 adenylate cyclase
MARDLPGGTVTFLFTDVEGSTRLLEELGVESYAAVLAEHRRAVREACGAHGGIEVDTQGDAFFVAFPTAPGALAAARAAHETLQGGRVRLRMGIHTGTPLLTAEGYVGSDVHRAARIAAAGHGGQVLISASTAALIGTAGLRDLGEHRLKDLSAPERIHQLGEEGFPPLRSLNRTNLPVPVTPFLGRERELAAVVALLGREDVRLLTMTGPGGTGKSRLCMQAAATVSEGYPDGVWWVPLAALRDPKLVTETAARVIGSRNGLAEHIGDRSMLLVLDNFEQVVEAAVDLAAVLAACPHLRLLATSREPLHIGGEHEYPVPPMAPGDGVALFLARARAVGADVAADAAAVEICRRLDDLPLAIELAAARAKVLSTTQILERLGQRLALLTGGARDVPERQRTLRGTIEWSHDLLTPAEQVAFRRLAAFRGGSSLEAAEGVAEADLDTLQSLVDKSLLRHVDGRFRMLETIRQYALERLEAAGETTTVMRRHAEHFVALAEEAYPHLTGSPKAWLDSLEADHDNLRAAADRLATAGETQLGLQLAGALWKFWYQRGHIAEGRRRLEVALAADPSPTAARARALNGGTGMASEFGDVAVAKRWADEALALQRSLGDAWGIANSLFMLAGIATDEKDWLAAGRLFEECLGSFRELGDDHYVMLTTDALAWTYDELGDIERARPLVEQNLARARATGNRRMEGRSLQALSNWARDDGRIDEALAMVEADHRINVDLGQRVEVLGDLSRFARILAAADRPDVAAHLLARSQALGEELGVSRPWEQDRDAETLAMLLAQLDPTALEAALTAGRALTVDAAVALAMAAGRK